MSTKTLTFCDLCNPLCIHQMDRREGLREGGRGGRRFTDNYSWIEAEPDEIADHGWIVTSNNRHVCPRCYAKHKDAIFSLVAKGPAGARD